MRDLMVVVATCAFLSLTGCSAFIANSGTNEEDIIYPGVTKADLSKRLGEPVELEVFDQPIPVGALYKMDKELKTRKGLPPKLLGRDPEMLTPDEVTERAFYRFNERLHPGKMAIAEGVVYDIATLGLTELFFTPIVMADSLWRPNTLSVWFEESGRARAYRWIRIETPSQQ